MIEQWARCVEVFWKLESFCWNMLSLQGLYIYISCGFTDGSPAIISYLSPETYSRKRSMTCQCGEEGAWTDIPMFLPRTTLLCLFLRVQASKAREHVWLGIAMAHQKSLCTNRCTAYVLLRWALLILHIAIQSFLPATAQLVYLTYTQIGYLQGFLIISQYSRCRREIHEHADWRI